MKRKIGIGTIIFGLISFVIGIICEVYQGQAVTVIGGADGPTSVFMAGKIGSGWIDGVTVGILFLIIGLCLVYNGGEKKS